MPLMKALIRIITLSLCLGCSGKKPAKKDEEKSIGKVDTPPPSPGTPAPAGAVKTPAGAVKCTIEPRAMDLRWSAPSEGAENGSASAAQLVTQRVLQVK